MWILSVTALQICKCINRRLLPIGKSLLAVRHASACRSTESLVSGGQICQGIDRPLLLICRSLLTLTHTSGMPGLAGLTLCCKVSSAV